VQGKTLKGRLTDITGHSVRLVTAEGKTVSIGIRSLAKEDKEYLRPIYEARRVAEKILHQEMPEIEQSVRKLEAMGEHGIRELHGAMAKWFRRENSRLRGTLASARTGATRGEKMERQIIELQKLARENIRVLDKGEPIRKAREYYDKLDDLHRKAEKDFAKRAQLLDKMDRIRAMQTVWQDVDGGVPEACKKEAESGIRAIEEVLGFNADDAEAAHSRGKAGPGDPRARLLWVHLTARDIAAFNAKGAKHGMSNRELANAELVNRYRELLGILPYEYDPRLVNSARGHSKEMVALKFFDHTSPTEKNRSPAQRMRNAGYSGGGWENIGYGSPSLDAKGAFWMWFKSPPHHSNMVNARLTALGVGEHGSRWTQNMGNAGRRAWE